MRIEHIGDSRTVTTRLIRCFRITNSRGRSFLFYTTLLTLSNQGLTLDFELRKHRDYQSAYHFLKRLFTTDGRPHCLVTDQYGGTLKAIKQVIKDGLLEKANHQCSKYRNNLIEQDHRFIKRHRVRSAGFQTIRTAAKTLAGVEVVHAIRKETRRNGSFFGFSVTAELKQLLIA